MSHFPQVRELALLSCIDWIVTVHQMFEVIYVHP